MDLKLIYHVERAECFRCVWLAVDAINEALKGRHAFPLNNLEKLRTLEAEFAEGSREQAWRGQVGCVDGAHFAQLNPGKAVKNPVRYHVARKDEYALLALAVCDKQRRFTYVDTAV